MLVRRVTCFFRIKEKGKYEYRKGQDKPVKRPKKGTANASTFNLVAVLRLEIKE